MKLIYVAGEDVSVLESQVLELLSYYIGILKYDVFLIQGYHSESEHDSLKTKLSKYPMIPVIWVKIPKNRPYYYKKQIDIFHKALLSIPFYEEAVIHTRCEHFGVIFKMLLKKYILTNPLLIDVRGIDYEEQKYVIRNDRYLRRLKVLCGLPFTLYSYKKLYNTPMDNVYLTFVSLKMVEYINKRYPHCSHQMFVNMNIAGRQFNYSEDKRKEIRQKYNIKDDELLAICSTGGGDVWQRDSLIIKNLLQKGIKVINLAKKDPLIDGCITTTVPFKEMPAYLSAGDIAVLWRDDTFMNQSASPSKFSEFAVMGLYVIHNKSVYVAEKYIRENNAGILVDNIESLQSIDFSITHNRKERCEAGKNSFSIDSIGLSYDNIYKTMIRNKTGEKSI